MQINAGEHERQQRMTLSFAVRRREPELIGPASPTPRETKRLSDLDDQDELRSQVRGVCFYRGDRLARRGDDPAGVIRRALSEALVHYYPLAGRLREVQGRKLVVDCTGEGVMFVEADADVRLADLEAAGLMPPFPCMEELGFDVEGSGGVLGCPLLLIQVTRLLCGGFVLWKRLNHTMCDGSGALQFLNAVAELARGLPAPTVAPAWRRELLDARSPPAPAFPHHEYDAVPLPPTPPADDMVRRSFVFRASDIAALKKGLRPRLRATSYEVLAASLWRARTAALAIRPEEEVRLATVVSARRHTALGLPAGYYGFACGYGVVAMAAGALLGCATADVVELIREAKASVTAEYVRSMADHLVLRGRPRLAAANLFLLSDLRHIGFHRVDFGWGEPVYGGPSHARFGGGFFVAVKKGDGEDAVAVPMALPRTAMEVFAAEMASLLKP